MREIDNKGFTLIELLAIIVITALVLGIGVYGVTLLINNSKEKATLVSVSSIKDGANIYSDEDNDRWIEPYGDDYSYFCTTIEELVNKGIIAKNATLPDGVNVTDYIAIKKNKVTLVKSNPIVLNGENVTKEEVAYKVCSGNDIRNEVVTSPEFGNYNSYTDSLNISFTDGDDDGIKDKWCQYDTNSSIEDGKNVITLDKDDTTCKISNLKDNTNYYVRVCKNTNGGSFACSLTKGYSTKAFVIPNIDYTEYSAVIKYDDSEVEKPSHYFKSNVTAKSNSNIYECDDSFNCNSSSTNIINKDKWYKVSDVSVTIDYSDSNSIDDGTIIARISDGSNNNAEVNSRFTLHKIIVDKLGNSETTYSCPSGYTCSDNNCNSNSTCVKTTVGTVTQKYYCSHNSTYQTSKTCSYVGGYYDDSYGLNCVDGTNCTYSCAKGVLDTGKCYADYASSCPSGWTKVKANGYCNIECGELTQGVSTSRVCTTSGLCSSYSSACCYYNSSKICGNTERTGCRITAYQYQCSIDATKSCDKVYTGGSYSGTTTTNGSCITGYTASRGSTCTTKINKNGSYYCDTRDYWKGKSCTGSMSTGATKRVDMNCSKTGDIKYYCSVTGKYTDTNSGCTKVETANVNSNTNTSYYCPDGYTLDSNDNCYKYELKEYSVN